jgi:CBS domain-containing protein
MKIENSAATGRQTSAWKEEAMPLKAAEVMSLTAAEIMKRDVVTAESDAPALRLAELLVENGTGVLPICAKDGSLLGLIDEEHLVHPLGDVSALHLLWWINRIAGGQASEHDCLQHVFLENAQAWELMNRNVVTAPESITLIEIAKLWKSQGVRPLPILREGKFVGLVGWAEVAAALARQADGDEAAPHVPG